MQHIFKFAISLSLVVIGFQVSHSQEAEIEKQDSVVYKSPYGLRLGLDISKPMIQSFGEDYEGLEFVFDYRISKSWYLAAELGTEQKRTTEDFTTSLSKGNYLRVGANYNLYDNWLDMNNEIYVGFRYGMSKFDQTLEQITINSGDPYFLGNPSIVNILDGGLTANWLEFMVGIKVETFKNFFVSFSGSYKLMISADDPMNFQALYAPGFNRIYASNTGFGFNYTLSYLIPFKKK